MNYFLSKLIPESDFNTEKYDVKNEKPFEAFSRVTSEIQKPSCIFVGENKYVRKAIQCDNVSMIITTPEIASELNGVDKGLCICSNPKLLYFKLLDYINKKYDRENSTKTTIGSNCQISPLAHIFENDVIIEDNVVIEDFVVIYPHTRIGKGCYIRSGAKIGAQDFNYYYENGVAHHIHHAGDVVIGQNTEIGLNTCVGRALYIGNTTLIGDDCKLCTNCGVGHDSRVGNRVMIYSGSMIAGNVIVEDDVHVTLNCTIKNGLKIGKGAMICMGSNVMTNVKEGTKVFGNPARRMDF